MIFAHAMRRLFRNSYTFLFLRENIFIAWPHPARVADKAQWRQVGVEPIGRSHKIVAMSPIPQSPASTLVQSALLTLVVWTLAATPAHAQQRKTLLTSGPWKAVQTTEKGRRVCYVEAAPIKKRRELKARGDVYIHVIHRIGGKKRARRTVEIGFSAGLALNRKGPVLIKIGRGSFRLVPNGDKAWTPSTKEDRRLLRAMIRGATLVMRSLSAKGEKVEDTYSLKGFTRAYTAARKACGLK
jgi:invasion protein IalB